MPNPGTSFPVPPPSVGNFAEDFESIANEPVVCPSPTLHQKMHKIASLDHMPSFLSAPSTPSWKPNTSRKPTSLNTTIDQQRHALLEHLTCQHCALVQFVEKQFQLLLISSDSYQYKAPWNDSAVTSRSTLTSTIKQSIDHDSNSEVKCGHTDAYHSDRSSLMNLQMSQMVSPIETGRSSFHVVSSHASKNITEICTSIDETDERVHQECSQPEHIGSMDRSTLTSRFIYFVRSSMAVTRDVKSQLDAHFTQKTTSVSNASLKKTATDMHIEEQLGRITTSSKIKTPRLDLFVALIICLNGITMALHVEWRGYKSAKTLGLIEADDDGWPNAESFFKVLEHVYTIIFILEMLIRLCYQGHRYFCEKANCFDAFLVFSAVLDTYVLPLVEAKGTGRNLTLLRFVRMFKFARVMRAVRMLGFCSALRVLVKTIVTGCYSLVWSVALLGLIMCGAGIIVSQMTESTVTDSGVPFERRMWIYHYYGTALRAMYTIFEVTLSGCWPNYARRLIHEVSGWWVVFWIVYILLVVFAVLRIISAIFLKDTLNNAKTDADMMIAEQMKMKEGYLQKLRNAFEAIDTKGNGVVSKREFDFVLQHPKVSAYLAVLDLEVHESSLLFSLLDEEGAGCITYDEFLEGVMRLKGQARALDVIAMQQDFKSLWRGLSYINENFERVFGSLDKNNPNAAAVKKLFERKVRGSKHSSLFETSSKSFRSSL